MHLSNKHQAHGARPWVKICGLCDASMIDVAIGRGANEIGLVHFAPSPRHLDINKSPSGKSPAEDRRGIFVAFEAPNAVDAGGIGEDRQR